MKKGLGLVMALLILTPVFAFSLPALAVSADNYWNANGTPDPNGAQFAEDAGLAGSGLDAYSTITSIIRWIMGFLGIIAVIIILIAGFKWMTAGGSEDKIGAAKKMLIAGLIGLVIVILAYAIANFVITQLVNVTTTNP